MILLYYLSLMFLPLPLDLRQSGAVPLVAPPPLPLSVLPLSALLALPPLQCLEFLALKNNQINYCMEFCIRPHKITTY